MEQETRWRQRLGDFEKSMDIDLAARFAKGATRSIAKIKSALDDLPIIYEIDLINETDTNVGNFKDAYEKTKQIFWRLEE